MRLLAKVVDDAANSDPDRVFAVIPNGHDLSDGFLDLTMKGLSHGVNFLCAWIESTIGKAQTRETLAYMGGNDIRYVMFLLACQKTGYQAFFPSPRNSQEAHLYLMESTNCSKLVFSEERAPLVQGIKAICTDMETFTMPSIKSILAHGEGGINYLYDDHDGRIDETICIIHSSGTTGMPKPVKLTNGFFNAMDTFPDLPWPPGRQPTPYFLWSQQERMLAIAPFFHLMGLFPAAMSIFHSVPIVIGPEKPISVDYLIKLFQTTRPNAALCPPSILEDLSHLDEALACLQRMDRVFFAGAPLSPDTGRRLQQYTQIVGAIGSSELGIIPSIIPEDDEDWGYFEWCDGFGIDMQSRGDGLYEMVITRQADRGAFQGIFHTYPELDSYPTNDLFNQHPTKPYLWKFNCRQDDVIVLSNGEKFQPVSMETIIESHPLVSKAMVSGQWRFQASLLVQPSPGAPDMSSKLFVEEIWPTVQAANQTVPTHGRVMKNKIGIASKAKPFRLTPKGTVQRRAVLNDFENEINEIYQAGIEEDIDEHLPSSLDKESVLEYVRRVISRLLEISDIPIDQDVFGLGLDSLMTMEVAKFVEKGVRAYQPSVKPEIITPQLIYGNPTVSQLAGAVSDIVEGTYQEDTPRETKVERLVEKYTGDMQHRGLPEQPKPDLPSTILLTGSTGSLGTYLLHNLLNCPSITRVYCLNRPDAESRQKESLKQKDLHVNSEQWGKVQFLQASFAEPRFGLSMDTYQELLQSVDTVIHNAWKVDFNHPVDSFEDTHIKGVRNFVDFSLNSQCNAHIHFVSSISTVGAWSPAMGPSVPETPMKDSSAVLQQGYGESKHTGERICLEASRKYDVPTTIHRVGQVAGPTTLGGGWNKNEWLPTIIATSKATGKIPKNLGSLAVDWVPVDTLSTIMIELIFAQHTNSTHECTVFHLTNPKTTPWQSLIPTIQEVYPAEPIDFSAWVADLESITSPTSTEVLEKPALKLLGFYRGVASDNVALSVPLDCQNAQRASATMRSLEPISATLMSNWLRQWSF